MCGFYHQPLMMALEYTAALMCLFNLSPISAVVPQWLQLLVGGWASTAWCCPQFLLLFLPLVSSALVVGCYMVEWTNRLMVIFEWLMMVLYSVSMCTANLWLQWVTPILSFIDALVSMHLAKWCTWTTLTLRPISWFNAIGRWVKTGQMCDRSLALCCRLCSDGIEGGPAAMARSDSW